MTVAARLIAVIAAALIAASGLPASPSASGLGLTTQRPRPVSHYTATGLPAYVIVTTTFTVTGPANTCSLTYGNVTVPRPSPYTFTVTPDTVTGAPIVANLCDGSSKSTGITPAIAFTVDRDIPTAVDAFTSAVTVTNFTDTDADATTTAYPNPGGDLTHVTVPAHGSAAIAIPTAGHKAVTVTVQNSTAIGVFPVGVEFGWRAHTNPPSGMFPTCTTLTWTYDPTGEPDGSSTVRADILAALASLRQQAGITFTETSDPAAADITYRWAGEDVFTPRMGGANTAAVATVGTRVHNTVTFNKASFALADANAGLEPTGYRWAGRGWRAARGWVVVHETMHILGFAHAGDPNEVMSPSVGVNAYGPGDLAGLGALYPTDGCPVTSLAAVPVGERVT